MQLHEVSEIKELFVVGHVNEALQRGWQIVAVVPSVEPGTGESGLVPCYVMGRKTLSPIQQAIADARVLGPVD